MIVGGSRISFTASDIPSRLIIPHDCESETEPSLSGMNASGRSDILAVTLVLVKAARYPGDLRPERLQRQGPIAVSWNLLKSESNDGRGLVLPNGDWSLFEEMFGGQTKTSDESPESEGEKWVLTRGISNARSLGLLLASS